VSSSEEALREQREWLHITLSSIGDAVITTATNCSVPSLNPVAESLTGWAQKNTLRIRKPGNNAELITLAIKDITDGKRMESELRASCALFHYALYGE